MKPTKKNRTYSQILPNKKLEEFVALYWEFKNLKNTDENLTIFPDSFFKIIIEVKNGQVQKCFLTGIWTKEVHITIPLNTTIYGIKFKISATESLLQREIASIQESTENLEFSFWNLNEIKFESFETIVQQLELTLLKKLKTNISIDLKKLELSNILSNCNGDISIEEISKKTNWKSRQINRYLNKLIGLSLKKYLNIRKCYNAYIQIREGKFFPENGYYDQSHFIREIKKHTNQTPKELFDKQNDHFVQLKNIRK